MPEQVKTPPDQEEERVLVHYDTRLPKLTFLQRVAIPIIGWAVWAVIRVLGPTIRFEVLGGQKAGAITGPICRRIFSRSGIAASFPPPGISEIATAY